MSEEITEKVQLFSIGKFTHTVFNGFYEVGKLIYNCANRQKPIIRDGKSSSEVLDKSKLWFDMNKAREDLEKLGFEETNENEWWKK